jgi:signal transduction histidine kinase
MPPLRSWSVTTAARSVIDEFVDLRRPDAGRQSAAPSTVSMSLQGRAAAEPDAIKRVAALPLRRAGVAAALVALAACGAIVFMSWPDTADGGSAGSWPTLVAAAAAAVAVITGLRTILAYARLERNLQAKIVRRRSEGRQAMQHLLERLPLAIAIGDARSGRAVPNPALARLLNIDPGIGPSTEIAWQQVIAADDWPRWIEMVAVVAETGREQWLRCAVQRQDEVLDVLALIVRLGREDQGDLAVVVRPESDDQEWGFDPAVPLRNLLEHAEAEQWRFAQAVHDELGQRLSGMAYFAKTLQRKLQQAGRGEADDAAWLSELANETMGVARGLARGLIPVGSDEPEALAAALGEVGERARRNFGIDFELHADPGFDPGGAARANHLYHAVQELITNAIKHGHARKIRVALEEAGGMRRVTVSNDGEPIGPRPRRFGMGLNGVRSRAAHLGGRFTLVDGADGAVIASIDLPRMEARLAASAKSLNAGDGADDHGPNP